MNPTRLKAGVHPPIEIPTQSPGAALGWAVLTLVLLLTILLVAMFGPETGGGFIYEQF